MGSLNMEFRALGYPAAGLAHPDEVVRDADLTLSEKRAMLAVWASDACAVQAAPALRRLPDGRVATFDDIMDALRLLDREIGQMHDTPGNRDMPVKRRGVALYRHQSSSLD